MSLGQAPEQEITLCELIEMQRTLAGSDNVFERLVGALFVAVMVLAGASLEEVADAMGNSPDVVFKHYFKQKGSKLAASGVAKLGAALNSLTSNQASCSPRMLAAGEGQ